jgi:heme/copper-type cytochrome/quinol oxidase subunit 4
VPLPPLLPPEQTPHVIKFQMAIRTRAIPLKMAMKNEAMAEMTLLIALAMAEMMFPTG